jgi:hypothetical protein
MKQRYGWGLVVVLAMSVACSGKKRPFGEGVEGDGVDMDGAGGSGMTAEAAPQPAAAGSTSEALPDPDLLGSSEPTNGVSAGSLGASCTSSSQCNAPGFCVDGVCCSSACTELCAACNVPGSVGTCSAAPSDAACGELACAGVDTECRKLDTSQLALNCEAFGACKVNADCAATNEPATTPCQAGTGTCDGAGACVVAGKAGLGEACIADIDCAEGHCVAGDDGARICCDAACDGPCQACSAAGHCDATPASDARCEAVACPADDVCRSYTADVTASQCRSFAQCQTARDCPFIALRPDAECECDAARGACRLHPGAACTDADQCASGVCTANAEGTRVCCSSACGEGLFCSSDGASCVACEGDAISCEGDVELRCNAGAIARVECRNGCTPGSGCNSLPPLGFLCDAGQCAAPNVCQPDVTGASRCCSRDCAAEGKVCAENGSCVCEAGQVASGNNCLLQNGDPCTGTQQCQAGSTCTDGVCCQQACNGTCERCEPNTGLCAAIAAGQTDNTCNNGRQCNGARGDCRLNVRQPCSGNGAECTTNNCEPTVGNATQICCSQACSGDRPFCRSNGQGCVQCETNSDCGNGCNTQTGVCNALLPIGTPCGTSSQCASGALCLLDQSSQTRCCERNCAAEGLLCNGAGRCVAPAPATLTTVTGGAPTPFPRTLVESTSTTTRLWTVQNTGGSASAPLSFTGNLEFTASGGCLGLALPPGGSCSVSLNFAPREAGTRRATLTLKGGPGVAVSVGVEGDARLADGEDCPSVRSLCDSNTCTEWFADPDGDGFGSLEAVGGFPSKIVCGDGSPANRPEPYTFVAGCRGNDVEIPYVTRNTTAGMENQGLDCCDRYFECDSSGSTSLTPDNAFPGKGAPTGALPVVGSSGFLSCGSTPEAGLARDFNCDGQAVLVPSSLSPLLSCTGRAQADCANGFGRTSEPDCAAATTAYTSQGCAFSGGQCSASNGGQRFALCL